jgi:hypothetical protein
MIMKIPNKILILSLIFFAILYTVCRFRFEPALTNGVLVGYLLGAVNFFSLARKIVGLVEGRASIALIFNGQIRLLGTGFVIWFAMVKLNLNIIGMLVGLSIIPVCMPFFVIYNNVKGKDNGTPT